MRVSGSGLACCAKHGVLSMLLGAVYAEADEGLGFVSGPAVLSILGAICAGADEGLGFVFGHAEHAVLSMLCKACCAKHAGADRLLLSPRRIACVLEQTMRNAGGKCLWDFSAVWVLFAALGESKSNF